jgi:L-2-hydroxyglutarate oxidase LhgO
MIRVDVTVVGGGMVGCAVAAEAQRRGLQTVLLEREPRLACGITARNSEVAHGGMYYPEGSLKARFCVRGRRLLKAFCAGAGVDYRETGKLIVAVTPDELPAVERLHALGEANGVEDLRLLEGAELQGLEPHVRAAAALLSPRTGILDAEGAARAYGELAAERGAQILTGAAVTGLAPVPGGWRVDVAAGRRESWSHESRWVVNAAGLYADDLAAAAGLDVDGLGLRQHWVKGNYFGVDAGRAGMIRHLVYPVPPADGSSLGIHVCLDRGGQLRLGPDMEALPYRREDYGVDPARRDDFFAGASRFLPFLSREELTPAMAGIRPKLDPHRFVDFAVRREEGALAGLVNLIGIDSPGLTSGPALAEHVGALLAG